MIMLSHIVVVVFFFSPNMKWKIFLGNTKFTGGNRLGHVCAHLRW